MLAIAKRRDARLLRRLAVPMEEGVMMCRVTAPLTALCRREAAPRPPFRRPIGAPSDMRSALHRRLRIVRHRALRWFDEPIASIARERRERELQPSLWLYDFRPWPALLSTQLARTRRGGGSVSPIRSIG